VSVSIRTTARGERPAFGARFVAPLLIGSMLNPINTSMIATALYPIGRSFGVGASATAWLVGGLYLATAVAQPAMGRIADRFGARRVFLAGLALVALAGIAGTLAPSLGFLLGVRVLLGIGTSAAYPSAMSMVRAESRRRTVATPGGVLGALTMAALTSAAVGPALGGLLVGAFGWPSIFAVNLPLALIGIVATLLWLPADVRSEGVRESLVRALDPAGLVLFAAAVMVLLFFLMNLAAPIWALPPLFVALSLALVVRERRAHHPFIDVRMLAGNGPLVVTYVRYGLTFLVCYGVLFGLTQWIEEGRGMSPTAAGLLMLPMSVMAALCSALGSRGRRVRVPVLIGTAGMLVGSATLFGLTSTVPLLALVAVGLLFGLPNGLSSVGNQAAMYAQAPSEQIGVAAGLFRTSQYIGAIFSAGLISVDFGQRATDRGLHELAVTFVVISAVLLVGALVDRTMTSTDPTRRPA
jgi:MFS family permease